MNLAPTKPPLWISSVQALTEAYHALKDQPCIAVDTESNSLFAYQEKVCLIQISSPDTDFIFDPFVLPDLSLLGLLFKNPSQQKIFHASEYDLICLKRDYQFTFVNIFDTMIATRILGAKQAGLGTLLQKYFDISLDKKFQRANWGMRPLPPEMLDYARLDTYYLFKLREVLESELITHGLHDLALEDFKTACKAQAHQNGHNHTECWKVAGANHIDASHAAILNELCIYRDEQAKKADLPLFKVLSNDLLVEIAMQQPSSLDELRTIPHCSEKIVKRHGNGLIKAVARGQSASPLRRQKITRPDETYLERIDHLKDWRKQKARELDVESDVVLPREILENIAAANPTSSPELKKAMINSPIRYKKYANLIMNTLKKKENQ